jgi:hypothetical protein
LQFDHFSLLLDIVSLNVLYLELDVWLEHIVRDGFKLDLNDLLLARCQSPAGVRDGELFGKSVNSRELPVGWDRADILQRQGLCELFAKEESVEWDNFLVDLNSWF